MRVLIADSNGQRARERAEQLLIDGHDPLLAAGAHAAHLKLAELPDVVLLCDLAGSAVTIGFLRALRAGTLHRADSRVARDRDRRRHRLRPHPLLPGRRRRAAAVRQLAAAHRRGARGRAPAGRRSLRGCSASPG
jgi:hypothetical protein